MRANPIGKILINMPDVSFSVSIISMINSYPDSLEIVRELSIEDLPNASLQPHSFIGQIYEAKENQISELLCDSLESHLRTQVTAGSGCTMLEFASETDPGHIYILAHSSDIDGLGLFTAGSKLGLFRFSVTELFGTIPPQLLSYMRDLQSFRTVLMSQYLLVKSHMSQQTATSQHNFALWNNSEIQLKELKTENNTLKNAVSFLNSQLNNLTQRLLQLSEDKMACVFCENSIKRVLVLPCGHLVACGECAQKNLPGPVNSRLEEECELLCPLCSQRVQELMEVKYQ